LDGPAPETRAEVIVGKMGIRKSLATRIRWAGASGRAVLVQLQRDLPDGFFDAPLPEAEPAAAAAVAAAAAPAEAADDAAAAAAAAVPATTAPQLSEEAAAALAQMLPSSIEPPYLVSRPPAFPRPRLRVAVAGCSGLFNGMLRPCNPYVRLTLSGTSSSAPQQQGRTVIALGTSAPEWGETLDNAHEFDASDLGGTLTLDVMDRKIAFARHLGRVSVAVAAVPMGKPTEFELAVPMVKKRVGGKASATLRFSVEHENLGFWWMNEELDARDRVMRGLRSDAEAGRAGKPAAEEVDSACVVS